MSEPGGSHCQDLNFSFFRISPGVCLRMPGVCLACACVCLACAPQGKFQRQIKSKNKVKPDRFADCGCSFADCGCTVHQIDVMMMMMTMMMDKTKVK